MNQILFKSVSNNFRGYTLNKIICEETINLGGSMVHHHGIGKHRVHWSKMEHGTAWPLLEGLKKQFDPNGIMNTGTIYPIEK